jgi:glutamine amidotransferase-like uncharacterized protein
MTKDVAKYRHTSAKRADLFARRCGQTKTVLVGLPFHFLSNYGPITEAQVNYKTEEK